MSLSIARYADVARQYWPTIAVITSGAALYSYGRRSARKSTPSKDIARIRATDLRNQEAIRVAPRAFLIAAIGLLAQVPRLLTEPRAAWRNVRRIVAVLSDEQAGRAGATVLSGPEPKGQSHKPAGPPGGTHDREPEPRDIEEPAQEDVPRATKARLRDAAGPVIPMARRPSTSEPGTHAESARCVQRSPMPPEFTNIKVRRPTDGIDGEVSHQHGPRDGDVVPRPGAGKR